MSLNAGTRLGPYELLSLIGAGGMGEVYKARDTRLNRTVAIKFLQPQLADPEHRARFEREARTIATLSHPHICTLHDIGHYNSSLFLVMELLVGETLAERLRKGPLPLERSLEYSAQIAEALTVAHRAGIVHRDLKPGNVMITKSGAKLLDFGLAKPHVGIAADASLSSLATHEASVTVQGAILGTPAYMSPEQLEGRDVDARSDLFSIGALVYEMLTGRRAFPGINAVAVIGAIISSDPPPLSSVSPLVPAALERVVKRCLAKDPDDRWQTARDLLDELRWVSESSSTAGAVDVAAKARVAWTGQMLGRVVLAFVAGVLVTAGAIGAWKPPRTSPSESPRTPMRLTITLPSDMPLAPAGLVSPAHDRTALALSPDGSHLAYVALIRGTTMICIRDMQTGSVTPLEQTVHGHTPFYSPDAAWLGFFADNKLWKIPSKGGDRTYLADAWYPWGATWGTDNRIYFNRSEGEGVFQVADTGGPVQPVTSLGLMPEFIREGPALLFSLGNVSYLDLRNSSEPRVLVQGGRRARYVSSGHLVYSSGSLLMAVPLDVASMTPTADPVPLLEDIRSASYSVAQFTLSNEGTLAYAPGRPQGLASFVWVDRKGTSEPLGLPDAEYETFALSPDGSRLAYGLGGEIFIWDRARRTSTKLTPRSTTGSSGRRINPCWTPDGRSVIYQATDPSSGPRLVVASVDGSTAPTDLWKGVNRAWADVLYPMGFSPDRSKLSFFPRLKNSSFDLFLMKVTASGGSLVGSDPEPFLATPFAETFGRISADGHWMLFTWDRSGAYEIWTTTYPKVGPMFKLSDDGGREAMWNPAEPGEVVYVNGRAMYAVDVSRGPDHAGKPRLLFDGPYPDVPGFSYDMAPDGRFLMLENKESLKPATTLTVMTNFLDYLRARVPPKAN